MPRKENRITRIFLLILVSSTLIRLLLSVFPKAAYTYNDELFYLELSQNLFLRGSLTVYGSRIHFTKLLYSLFLAPFYAVSDGVIRTQLISAFNALLISSSLVPGFFLARRILKKDWQVILALVFLALSPNLLFSITFMSENLYYPLLLWSFWAAYRWFSSDKRKPLHAATLGVFAFLLYFTKEVGAAWITAMGAAVLADSAARKTGSADALRSFGCYLAGFLVPFLFLRFIILQDLSYSYTSQVSLANLSSSSQILYLCYAALVVLMYFLMSFFFFPAALPVIHRKKLSPAGRSLLLLITVYVIVVSLGVAFGVSLSGEYPHAALHIHLRYFIGAAFPFLLLSLSLADDMERLSGKHALVRAFAAFACASLLLSFTPGYGSVLDHPVLFFTRLIPASGPWQWVCKIVFVLLLLALLFLWNKRKKQAFVCLLFPVLFALELFSGILFTQVLTKEEAVTDSALLAEVRQLDQFLDSEKTPVLMLADSPSSPKLRLANTVLNDDYCFATFSSLKDLAEKDESQGQISISLTSKPFCHPIREYALTQFYNMPRVSRIVTVGKLDILDLVRNEEITPEGFTIFHIYRAEDPTHIALTGPLSYTLGETISFYSHTPVFRKYLPEGFSATEDGYTWTNGTESALTLVPNVKEPCDLSCYWTWRMTLGMQYCQIFANDTLLGDIELYPGENELSFYIPAYAYEDTGTLTLRFLFPSAHEPNATDHRLLAVAFESLVLEAE